MTKDEIIKITGNNNSIASREEQDRIAQVLSAHGFVLPDLYQELEMSSFYVDTHQDISYGGAVIHLHSHSFYELICIRSASEVEYVMDTECVRIQPGDVLILPPGVPHRPLMAGHMSTPYTRDVLWLNQEFIQIVANEIGSFALPQMGIVLHTRGTKWSHIPELFRNGVLETESSKNSWQLATLGNTLLLIAELRRALSDRKPLPRQNQRLLPLEQALEYIDDHYQEKITLSDLSNYCFVSESTICHMFREKMNVSFHQYLTQRRLIAAKEQIMTGRLLEDVGKTVGFPDYAAFYRAFKREYGITPKQYKDFPCKWYAGCKEI